MSLSALATLLLARSLHGAPGLGPLLNSALRGGAGTAVAAGAATLMPVPAIEGLLGAGIELVVRSAVFGGLALGATLSFGDDATRAAVERLLVRLRLRRKP
jgi:hypothetical protein